MKRRWWKRSDDLTADRVWELATELGYGPALDELTEAVDLAGGDRGAMSLDSAELARVAVQLNPRVADLSAEQLDRIGAAMAEVGEAAVRLSPDEALAFARSRREELEWVIGQGQTVATVSPLTH